MKRIFPVIIVLFLYSPMLIGAIYFKDSDVLQIASMFLGLCFGFLAMGILRLVLGKKSFYHFFYMYSEDYIAKQSKGLTKTIAYTVCITILISMIIGIFTM